jgi:CheY-like chemotaxis protein
MYIAALAYMAANYYHDTQASPQYDVLILDVHMPKVSINSTL